MVSYQKHSSESRIVATNRLASYVLPEGSDTHRCTQCGLTGRLAIVCESVRPITEAYVSYSKYTPNYNRGYGSRPPPRLPSSGIYHSNFISKCVETWIVDSGASSHMTPNIACFDIYKPFNRRENVRFGNGAFGRIEPGLLPKS